MPRHKTCLVWVLGFAVIAAATRPAAGQTSLRERLKSGVLRWGGDAEGGAPYQFRDPKDISRVIGFEVEIANALAGELSKKIGSPVKAEFVQYEWTSLPLGLGKGDFDVVISGLENTPENRAAIRFTRPYYIFAQQLSVRKDETRIKTLADCHDKAVGTLSGSAAERLLKREKVGRIVAFDGQVEPYLDMERGRLDAVLLDSPIALYYASTNKALKLVGQPIDPGEYGVGLRPADRELAAALDEGLSQMMRDGRLAAIFRRWHLWNLHQVALARGPAQADEQLGLGFGPKGEALAGDEPIAGAVDIEVLAASGHEWTFSKYAPRLIAAAGMTVLLTFASMAFAMILGLIISIARLYGPMPVRALALGYVEFFRGTPLLLLLFFLYYGLSDFGLHIPQDLRAVVTAIVGFGLNYAAYEAEIYRSAILSVPRRQWEAPRALGMSDEMAFYRVILPQAIRTALGPMTNDFVALFKDTSLVSVIAVHELTKEYMILSRSSLKFVELGILTAILYLAMSVPLGYLSRYLERRWGTGQAI